MFGSNAASNHFPSAMTQPTVTTSGYAQAIEPAPVLVVATNAIGEGIQACFKATEGIDAAVVCLVGPRPSAEGSNGPQAPDASMLDRLNTSASALAHLQNRLEAILRRLNEAGLS